MFMGGAQNYDKMITEAAEKDYEGFDFQSLTQQWNVNSEYT